MNKTIKWKNIKSWPTGEKPKTPKPSLVVSIDPKKGWPYFVFLTPTKTDKTIGV